MSDPLTPQDREALRRWATGQATKLGRQLRALLAERDRLEQERDEVVRALRQAVALICAHVTSDSDFNVDAKQLRALARKFRHVPMFPATHPAEEPEAP